MGEVAAGGREGKQQQGGSVCGRPARRSARHQHLPQHRQLPVPPGSAARLTCSAASCPAPRGSAPGSGPRPSPSQSQGAPPACKQRGEDQPAELAVQFAAFAHIACPPLPHPTPSSCSPTPHPAPPTVNQPPNHAPCAQHAQRAQHAQHLLHSTPRMHSAPSMRAWMRVFISMK